MRKLSTFPIVVLSLMVKRKAKLVFAGPARVDLLAVTGTRPTVTVYNDQVIICL